MALISAREYIFRLMTSPPGENAAVEFQSGILVVSSISLNPAVPVAGKSLNVQFQN